MNENFGEVTRYGRDGFMEAVSFVGHLVWCGLVGHELVRLYLIKSLMSHGRPEETVRVNAIC